MWEKGISFSGHDLASLGISGGIPVFFFVIGLCIGSFLNVVGLRFLKEESIRMPPSHCPHCKTPLKAWENIPLLSYFILRGRCRTCHAGISIQYPLVELATGLLFLFAVFQFGLGWQTLFVLFFIANLMVIVITDWKESLIFEINSLSLIPAGLIFSFFNLGGFPTDTLTVDMGAALISIPGTIVSAIIAIIGAYIFFEGLIFISQLAFGTEGFGHGDTHLMMGVGAYMGWKMTLLALVLGFIAQSVLAIPLLFYQWYRQKDFLSLGSGVSAFCFGFLPLGFPLLHLPVPLQNVLLFSSIILSLVSLVLFLCRMRHRQSYTYLPLGPALILGSLVALFFGPALLVWLHPFIGL